MREEMKPVVEDEGVWDVEMEVRPHGQPPARGKAVSTNRIGCSGEWLIVDFAHESGFEAHGIYGYDTLKKKYTGLWVDSMRTFFAVLDGTYDAQKRTMELHGSFERPDGPYRWREVTERPDADTRIFRHYSPGPGGEYEMIHAVYRRRKA